MVYTANLEFSKHYKTKKGSQNFHTKIYNAYGVSKNQWERGKTTYSIYKTKPE